MREFSLDLDKITKTIFFCKKVFVSTCLHCFNAATPLVWSKLYELVFVPLIYAKLDIHLN
jgi:hypothetical protein